MYLKDAEELARTVQPLQTNETLMKVHLESIGTAICDCTNAVG
jgi:hypothetical protein